MVYKPQTPMVPKSNIHNVGTSDLGHKDRSISYHSQLDIQDLKNNEFKETLDSIF